MKFARSWKHGTVGVVVFIVLVLIGMSVCADRGSKQLEGVDITWEDIQK